MVLVILGLGCLASSTASAQMYWSNGTVDSIQRAELDGTGIATVQQAVNSLGVALDAVAGKLYWTDQGDPLVAGDESIFRSNVDGSAVELLAGAADGLEGPGDIELDLAGGKIYWAGGGASGARISRANLDGSAVEVIFRVLDHRAPNFGSGAGQTLEFASVWGLAIDTVGRQMYWTDFFGGDIHRANLDGSAVSGPLVTGLATPRGICVDPTLGFMYWTEAGNSTISRAALDGTNVQLIASDLVGADQPFAVAIDSVPGKLYWTNIAAGTIQRADTDGQNVETLVVLTGQDLIDLAITATAPVPSVAALSETGDLVLVCLLAALAVLALVRSQEAISPPA